MSTIAALCLLFFPVETDDFFRAPMFLRAFTVAKALPLWRLLEETAAGRSSNRLTG